jgi:hypothetical protein
VQTQVEHFSLLLYAIFIIIKDYNLVVTATHGEDVAGDGPAHVPDHVIKGVQHPDKQEYVLQLVCNHSIHRATKKMPR